MSEKYYTPTIEEFHVGFEYEFLKNGIWHMDTMECINDYQSMYVAGGSFPVRVKYFDKGDIESLGFKYIEEGDIYINDNGLMLSKNGDGTISIYDDQYDWVNCIEIKNKSELKKLLQQLKAI